MRTSPQATGPAEAEPLGHRGRGLAAQGAGTCTSKACRQQLCVLLNVLFSSAS